MCRWLATANGRWFASVHTRQLLSLNTGRVRAFHRDGLMSSSLAAEVVETAADAIVLTCPAGAIKTWNRGACEIFGVTTSEAVGKDLTELIIPAHVRHIRPLDPRPQQGRQQLRRAPAARADGTHFTAEFTVQVMGDSDEDEGSASGTLVTLRDASAMGETVRRLRVRVAEVESQMERLVQLSQPSHRGRSSAGIGEAGAGMGEEDAGLGEGGAASGMLGASLRSEPAASLNEAPGGRDKVQALLASQVQCVLATTQQDRAPATFLMAFAASHSLRTIFLATPLAARKAHHMMQRPTVSLLWDNRTGSLTDHGQGLLVSASGRAALVSPPERARASARFLERNPNMEGFLASDGVAIFAVRVSAFEVVQGYGRPEQWQP